MTQISSLQSGVQKRLLSFFVICFTILALILIPAIRDSRAADLSLSWDANSDPETAGYKIYYGTHSGTYTTVVDIGNYTSCTIADLDEGQSYYVAATAYDATGAESDYSAELCFVIDRPQYDSDGNSVPDCEENEEITGLADGSDPSVIITTGSPVSVDTAAFVEVPDTIAAPNDVDFPFGFFNFSLSGVGSGGATTVSLVLPEGVEPQTFYKFGPTPDNPIEHWYEFMYDGETGAVIEDNLITLYFIDGKRGDNDLNATNGIIVDPGGPGFTEGTISVTGGADDGGTGGGGCFITTASCGSHAILCGQDFQLPHSLSFLFALAGITMLVRRMRHSQ